MKKTRRISMLMCLIFVCVTMMSLSATSDWRIDESGKVVFDETVVALPEGLVAGTAIYDRPGGTAVGFAVSISDGESVLTVPRYGKSDELIGYEVAISDKEWLLIVPRKGNPITPHVDIIFSDGRELSITLIYDGEAELIPLSIPFYSEEGLLLSFDEIYTALSALVGCGAQIKLYDIVSGSTPCHSHTYGFPNCAAGVDLYRYRCDPSCLAPGGYTGFVYKCRAGHTLTMGGLIMGAHY